MADTTTIQVLNSQWSDLNGAKESPGESMKDALARVLDVYKTVEEHDIDLDSLVDEESDVDETPAEETAADLEDSSGRERAPGEDVVDDRDVATDVERGPVSDERDRETAADAVDLDELLADWKPGLSREKREKQKAAGKAALEVLRDGDRLIQDDFRDALLPEYDVEDQSADTWWRKSILPALNAAKEEDLATLHWGPPHEYEWIGGEADERY